MKFPKIQWFKAKLDPDPNEAAVATQEVAGRFDAKRWAVLGALVGLLVLAAYTNMRMNDAATTGKDTGDKASKTMEQWEADDLAAAKAADDAADAAAADAGSDAAAAPEGAVITTLSQFASERDKVRAQEIAYLDGIIEKSDDAEMIAEAEKQKLALVDSMEAEVTLQGLLVAKGFEGAVVTVHPDSVYIVVQAEKLTEAQTARIYDMAIRETGQAYGNISVVPSQAKN